MEKRTTIFLIIAIIFISILSSCTSEKRVHMPGYNVVWKNSENSKDKINIYNNVSEYIASKTIYEQSLTASAKKSLYINEDINLQNTSSSIINSYNQEIKTYNTSDSCDLMILRNGEEIAGKVLEIGINNIKYKNCNYIDGPTIVIDKADVFMIKYSNNTKEVFNYDASVSKSKDKVNKADKAIEGIGLAAYLTSFVGLGTTLFLSLFLGLGLSVFSIISGTISLMRIESHPEKFKGRGFSISSIIIGAISITFTLILINIVLM